MQKTIYLVRHGQTDYNKKGIVQGSGIDASLNDLGRLQSEAFYEAYRKIPFDKIYISGLKRTKESISLFIKDGLPFDSLAGLNEISWGKSEGTEFTNENNTLYKKLVQDWKDGKTHLSVEAGESPEDVMRRQKEAIEYILQQPNEKNILICMHGRAMRILLCWLLDKPLSSMDEYMHNNLGLYVLHFKDEKFELATSNDLEHLLHLKEI